MLCRVTHYIGYSQDSSRRDPWPLGQSYFWGQVLIDPSSILTFDQREFHDAMLKNGALPLEILEEQVNEYIRQKKT